MSYTYAHDPDFDMYTRIVTYMHSSALRHVHTYMTQAEASPISSQGCGSAHEKALRHIYAYDPDCGSACERLHSRVVYKRRAMSYKRDALFHIQESRYVTYTRPDVP